MLIVKMYLCMAFFLFLFMVKTYREERTKLIITDDRSTTGDYTLRSIRYQYLNSIPEELVFKIIQSLKNTGYDVEIMKGRHEYN